MVVGENLAIKNTPTAMEVRLSTLRDWSALRQHNTSPYESLLKGTSGGTHVREHVLQSFFFFAPTPSDLLLGNFWSTTSRWKK